ncbi:MAG: helix-turn-helix transcriptional regulator [Azospirillaceae bacterium]|nr:helix-turn-helix transcriptional regulator [Azospirillaceae bacterium]
MNQTHAARKAINQPIDIHVGGRLKLRRTLLGLSQEKLGEALGLTFQQVQKYERGANRISASMLHRLSELLDVPVSFFFFGVEDATSQPALTAPVDETRDRATLELCRAFGRLTPRRQDWVLKMVKELASDAPALAAE